MTRLTLAMVIIAPLLTSGAQLANAQPPLVATHYFYWYRYPDEHFGDGTTSEGHTHQFVRPESVDYTSASWHREQFRAMAACGIDAALPVYWGAPDAYERRGLRFSRAGLPSMMAALEEMDAAGERTVRLGLFYDTSTLRNGVRGVSPGPEGADLTTEAGLDLFCRTIIEYFEAIPERWWARLDGRPLVVLYSSAFAARWDAGVGPALGRRFSRRFPGQRPLLVADVSWGDVGQDLTTSWGAAIAGPRLFPGVAQIGPGYDDTPVPGRFTPIREREEGAFYRHAWRAAIAHRPRLVLIETWNEMHEGTEICETVETGKRYLAITADRVAALKLGLSPGPEVALRELLPRPRPDRGWGASAHAQPTVQATWGDGGTKEEGLRAITWEDGPFRVVDLGLSSSPAPGKTNYLYFKVSDHWRFDTDATFLVTVEHAGPEVRLQFDSRDTASTLEGAYTRAEATKREPLRVTTRTTFRLPRSRFANRQNGGCDFRLVVTRPTNVKTVLVRPEPMKRK